MKLKLTHKIANLLLSFLGILLLVCTEPALDAARSALRICALNVIPSLFPYMVLSGLIARQNLLSPVEKLIPMRKLFALPTASACPFLLGALCGFPIGAKTAAELYTQGRLTKEKAESVCALSNNTGPAFAVITAGKLLWNSTAFGWYLYGAQILSAVLVGFLLKNRKKGHLPPLISLKSQVESPIRSFAQAVSSAATAVIPLCGYIVFFSVLAAMVKEVLPFKVLGAILCALLEFTTGIREAASIGGTFGLFLTGFSLGFSGISVFVQSYSFTAEAGISLRKTFLSKGIQGLLCGGFCTLFPIFSH